MATIRYASERGTSGKQHSKLAKGFMNGWSCHSAYQTLPVHSWDSWMRCYAPSPVSVSWSTLMIYWFTTDLSRSTRNTSGLSAPSSRRNNYLPTSLSARSWVPRWHSSDSSYRRQEFWLIPSRPRPFAIGLRRVHYSTRGASTDWHNFIADLSAISAPSPLHSPICSVKINSSGVRQQREPSNISRSHWPPPLSFDYQTSPNYSTWRLTLPASESARFSPRKHILCPISARGSVTRRQDTPITTENFMRSSNCLSSGSIISYIKNLPYIVTTMLSDIYTPRRSSALAMDDGWKSCKNSPLPFVTDPDVKTKSPMHSADDNIPYRFHKRLSPVSTVCPYSTRSAPTSGKFGSKQWRR